MVNKNKFFKFTILNLLLTLMFSLNTFAQVEAVQTSFTISGNEVTVYMKSNQNITSLPFNYFQVDFKYYSSNNPVIFSITSYNSSLMNSGVNQNPSLISNNTDPNNIDYSIQRFGFSGGNKSVTLISGTEYEVFKFTITNGIGYGSIGLVYDYTNYSSNPYIEFNSSDYTNWTEPFYGLSLNNSDYSINGEDWMWRTLDMYFGKYWKSNAASTAWATAANWSDNAVPTASQNITILSGANQPIAGAASECNKLKIESGATVNIAYNGDLTVNGDLLIADDNSLIVKSTAAGTGSLITYGNVPSGNKVKIERYITGYTSSTDGWRFVSSPVGNTAIGNFAPGASDDFFKYNETTDMWENYAVSPFGFTKGMGYLAAYASSATKSFSGTLNNTDAVFSNLTSTPIALPATSGWHLLGNPFSSAIKWNDGNWALSNVDVTAKVLNGGGTYTDLGANDIIPAMQGFLVQVSNATNSITIPAAARVHSTTNLLNKSTITENLKLTALSIGNNTYVESIIKTDASATNGFDINMDANFVPGLTGAPQLYTNTGIRTLSTNVLPTINNNVVMVPVSFIAGSATNYKLTADGINTFNCSAITLVDLKTNTSHNLIANPVYNFTASASDNANRFQLYFNSAVGIDENNQANSTIYSNGNEIYVSSANAIRQISIYNTLGQLIHTANNPQGLFKYSMNDNSTGYYIVKVITDKNVNSEKVFVK